MATQPLSDKAVGRLISEMRHVSDVRAFSDGELVSALIKEVWVVLPLWERRSVLIDEAITRLRRVDIQRRWDARKERRKR